MNKILSMKTRLLILFSFIFFLSIILLSFFRNSSWRVVLSQFFMISGLLLLIFIILSISDSIKKMKKDKKRWFEISLLFWKWFNLFEIFFIMMMVIVSIIIARNLFTSSITISPLVDCLLNAVSLIFAIIVIYNLHKRNYVAYCSSIISCFLSIILDVLSIIKDSSRSWFSVIFLSVFLVFYIFMTYILYRNRTYFGVKK